MLSTPQANAHTFATELALIDTDPHTLDAPGRTQQLTANARLRSYLHARELLTLAACRAHGDAVALGATGEAELLKRAGSVNGHVAHRQVRTSVALTSLPAASAALADGAISIDHAAVLGALWDDLSTDTQARLMADETELLDHARQNSPETFRRRLAAWHRDVAENEADELAETRRRQRTKATTGHGDDGMGHLNAALTPEGLAVVNSTLDGLVDEYWRAEHGTPDQDHDVPRSARTNAQRRADAFVEMARRAAGATAADGRKVKPALHVLMDLTTLRHGLHQHSCCELGDGTPISAAAARRLACEANIIPHVLGSDSRPLDIGRGGRLATDAQRDALRVQYHGCCGIAGCEVPFDYCDIHHILWWEHDGPTDLLNMVPLCSKHHHFVHDRHWTLRQKGPDAYTLDPPTLMALTPA